VAPGKPARDSHEGLDGHDDFTLTAGTYFTETIYLAIKGFSL